ncbi:hypothetical protein TNCV_2607861 [Trichonephila clavipes]|uniref:Uncharacterized protein n=1 Tax=Trichonephila clavipes TaxID=2585209 RepID=A0A8X6S297_TRICX|nr:hypothetical protein TNCV_2607861 [Trichonephila clavipes]
MRLNVIFSKKHLIASKESMALSAFRFKKPTSFSIITTKTLRLDKNICNAHGGSRTRGQSSRSNDHPRRGADARKIYPPDGMERGSQLSNRPRPRSHAGCFVVCAQTSLRQGEGLSKKSPQISSSLADADAIVRRKLASHPLKELLIPDLNCNRILLPTITNLRTRQYKGMEISLDGQISCPDIQLFLLILFLFILYCLNSTT